MAKEYTKTKEYKFFNNTGPFSWNHELGWFGFYKGTFSKYQQAEKYVEEDLNEFFKLNYPDCARWNVSDIWTNILDSQNYSELSFLRFWLDELIKWESYCLWNYVFNSSKQAMKDAQAEQRANEAVQNLQKDFL